MRTKTKILYSRNGIRIIKSENSQGWFDKKMKFETITRVENLENISIGKSKYKTEVQKIQHESPLGFYYYTTSYYNSSYNHEKPKCVTYRKYILYLDSDKYEMEYPIAYDNHGDHQSINVEMRPWDICPGYKGIPDNMIQVLFKEAKNFIDILYDHKNIVKNLKDIQYDIMTDLFGYPDGPKIQPNNIKILSHGFDLKTSFRKPKES